MTEILEAIKSLEKTLLKQQGPYCTQIEACIVIGFLPKKNNYTNGLKKLKWLRDEGYLHFAAGRGMVYKRSDCELVAAAIDRGDIVLPKHKTP
jgi:hypothetical protein